MLTLKQFEVFTFIKQFITDNCFAPTYQEIGKNFGYYPNAASEHVSALIRKGAVTVEKGKCRSIRLSKGYRAKVKK